MKIRALFFASLREQAGCDRLELELDDGVSVRELAATLEDRLDGLRLAGSLCAVNERYAAPDAELRGGDVVAFLPPVSGG